MQVACHTLHPEAIAWAKAATNNGGTFTTRTLRAVSTFAADVERAGIRDRFLRLNLVCGTNLAAARTPLYRGESRTATQYGDPVDVNNGPFVSGDYSESQGLLTNYLKFFDTTITCGTLYSFGAQVNNVHASVYACNLTSGMFGGADEYGVENYVACAIDAVQGSDISGYGSVATFYLAGYWGDGRVYGPTGSQGAGFFLGNCESGPSGTLTKNGVDITAGQNLYLSNYESGSITPLVFGAVASTDSGVQDYYYPANGRVAAYSVGKAFTTSGQRTAFYNAMQAFQTALGRAV